MVKWDQFITNIEYIHTFLDSVLSCLWFHYFYISLNDIKERTTEFTTLQPVYSWKHLLTSSKDHPDKLKTSQVFTSIISVGAFWTLDRVFMTF